MMLGPTMRCRQLTGRPVCVQPDRDPAMVDVAVVVVLHVLFATPHHLDGPVHLLRDAHRLGNVVRFETPTKASAKKMVVYDYLLDRQSRGFGGKLLCAAECLVAAPDIATDPR